MSVTICDSPEEVLRIVIADNYRIAIVKNYTGSGYDVVCFHEALVERVRKIFKSIDQRYNPTEEGTRSDILWVSVDTRWFIEEYL